VARKRRELTPEEQRAAERLRKIWERKKRNLNLTQESAAIACGWESGQSAMSQYLGGFVPLNVEAVLKLAKVLQVHPTEIMPEVADLLPPLPESESATGPELNAETLEFAVMLGTDPDEQVNDPGETYEVDPRAAIQRDGPPGLRELAADDGATATLGITPDEWRRLAAVGATLPPTVDKAGFVQLLFTLRTITR
jgi:transcriptional regulator with XRE-family HTH domain